MEGFGKDLAGLLDKVPHAVPLVSLSMQIRHGKLSNAERIREGIISGYTRSIAWEIPRADSEHSRPREM